MNVFYFIRQMLKIKYDFIFSYIMFQYNGFFIVMEFNKGFFDFLVFIIVYVFFLKKFWVNFEFGKNKNVDFMFYFLQVNLLDYI